MKAIPEDIQKMFDKYSGSETNDVSSNKEETWNRSQTNSNSSNPFGDIASSFFKNASTQKGDAQNPFGNIDMDMIFKMKKVMDTMNSNKDNPKTNLLRSLKPYLKPSRKEKLEQYIGFLNMEQVVQSLGILGGEKKQ